MKTKNITFLVVFSMLMLTGCDFLPYFTSSSSYSAASSIATSSSSSSLASSTVGSDTGDGYYKATSYSSTFADLKYESGYVNLNSTGNQNILVIPVNFTDYPCSSLGGGCSSVKTKIQKTFFGASSDTGWESVASFYEASSYGKLTITGTVTDWFTLDKTTTQLAALTSYGDPTYYVLRAAVNWYKTQVGNALTGFDQNSDGYIDAVWLVYSAPNYTNEASLDQNVFWAYTYWDYMQDASISSPVANVYGWASYDFMYDGYGTTDVDAHTYIHETGHVMGLDDYYSYTDGDWGAAGGLDMMDYNVLDHNAYSKMALEWTYPYVIDGTKSSTSLTLNPFESSGDCVLINNSWNGSPLDEYLLLEFYTPTGLNYMDSHFGGYVNGVQGYTIPGIKIYHIDSRMGRLGWSDASFISFTNSIDISSGSYYTDIVVSNSSEYSIANANYKLVHLLEAGGTNTFKNYNAIASNGTLFTEGDTFSPTSFANFFYISGKFDDNTSIGYSISVNSVSSSSASVTINRL